jgi:hypothetical protein
LPVSLLNLAIKDSCWCETILLPMKATKAILWIYILSVKNYQFYAAPLPPPTNGDCICVTGS